ncbi:hypothetical protein ACL02S_23895 [Nocardia sp. 004]|uniref:hypothetical protein n=1 Tax=Nocardia sp. 004 TaxID=3385978 RepID=UPI0039A3D5B7
MSSNDSEGWKALGVDMSGFDTPAPENSDQNTLFDNLCDTSPPQSRSTNNTSEAE